MGYSTKIKLGSANQLDMGVIRIREAIKNEEGAKKTRVTAQKSNVSAQIIEEASQSRKSQNRKANRKMN